MLKQDNQLPAQKGPTVQKERKQNNQGKKTQQESTKQETKHVNKE